MPTWKDAEEVIAGDDSEDRALALWLWVRPDRTWTPDDTDPAPAAAAIPAESLLDGLKSGRVRGNLEKARLSPAQRKALELRLAGRRSREIGEAMKCSPATARKHLATALDKVRLVAIVLG